MTYRELIARACFGAHKFRPEVPQSRLQTYAESLFPSVSSELAEVFASKEGRRPVLRNQVALTFAAGSAVIPNVVLKRYLRDATLVLPPTVGFDVVFIEPTADFYRIQDDLKFGYWAVNDNTMLCNVPSLGALIPYVGAGTLTCITAPAVPTNPDAQYTGPDDFNPQLIDALINALAAHTLAEAAEVAGEGTMA